MNSEKKSPKAKRKPKPAKKKPEVITRSAGALMTKWSKYEILSSLIGRVGHMFTYQNASEKAEIRFTDVRGGLAWPTDSSPFYCVILGQKWFDQRLYYDKSATFEIIFEAVDRGLDLERRFGELADISSMYKCAFQADLGTLHEPESDSWYDFRAHKSLEYGDLEPAPWCDNFRMGIELCKTSVRTHKLTLTKDTEIFDQLARITETDLAEKDVKSKYFAAEALRHALASFKRDPADLPDVDTSRRGRGGSGPQGWLF